MKHKFIVAAGAALVTAAVSAFVYVKNGSSPMDEFFNANVEALASDESSSSAGCDKYCYNKPSSVCASTIYGYDFKCPDMALLPKYQ
ncbi:MAG: NVEALA domain-containing protein [Clostridium sp.]|nr:NVEALA domain-containing protein [Bacteroides sp.]MCM1199095.1 NVEALA domain-containing protein [Clostridium sp.]